MKQSLTLSWTWPQLTYLEGQMQVFSDMHGIQDSHAGISIIRGITRCWMVHQNKATTDRFEPIAFTVWFKKIWKTERVMTVMALWKQNSPPIFQFKLPKSAEIPWILTDSMTVQVIPESSLYTAYILKLWRQADRIDKNWESKWPGVAI